MVNFTTQPLYSWENNVHKLRNPPHIAHKSPLLYRTFIKPFKLAYSEACSSWIRRYPRLRISNWHHSFCEGSSSILLRYAQCRWKETGFFAHGYTRWTGILLGMWILCFLKWHPLLELQGWYLLKTKWLAFILHLGACNMKDDNPEECTKIWGTASRCAN
jgi:hypothetical protein